MLDLGLCRSAAPGRERLLAGRVGWSATVRDVEAEGLAYIHLGAHERGDELEAALVLDAADGTHLGEDVLDGGGVLAINVREFGTLFIDYIAVIIRLEHIEDCAYACDTFTFFRMDAMIVQHEGISEVVRILLPAQCGQWEAILGAVELDVANIASENAFAL